MSKHENETARLFDGVWRRGAYSGFSRDTAGERATPFLDAFLQEVRALGVTAPRLLELGAGSCDHALRCALEGFPTTAVEYSGVAVAAARERARRHAGLELEIVQADLFAYTAQLGPGRLAGVYSNSVFHFMSVEQRRGQYATLRGALLEGGVLAVSFKADGDAIQRRGRAVAETRAGAVVEGDDGIRRLFVARAEPLVDELRDEGYEVHEVIRWSVPGYNLPNENGEFVGLIAAPRHDG